MFHLPDLLLFLQIVLIDVSLAGDNALVVGMAAAGLPEEKRHRAIVAGIAAATILRTLFAVFAVQILHITGLLLAGGLLLLWVAWKMYRELPRKHPQKNAALLSKESAQPKKLSSAIWQIVVADVSMSLDNVLGIAGVARDHLWIMAAGLVLSVMLMGAASTLVARIAGRHGWIGFVGIAVLLYAALHMIWDGLKPFSLF